MDERARATGQPARRALERDVGIDPGLLSRDGAPVHAEPLPIFRQEIDAREAGDRSEVFGERERGVGSFLGRQPVRQDSTRQESTGRDPPAVSELAEARIRRERPRHGPNRAPGLGQAAIDDRPRELIGRQRPMAIELLVGGHGNRRARHQPAPFARNQPASLTPPAGLVQGTWRHALRLDRVQYGTAVPPLEDVTDGLVVFDRDLAVSA